MVAGAASVLVHQAWRCGVTVDEPVHLLTAHLYWRGEDNLEPSDMPPLIKIAGGWASHVTGLPLVREASRQAWAAAREMMQRMKTRDRVQRICFGSRLPMIVFTLLTAILLWWWTRQLYSPALGLVLAAMFLLEPNVLGHGALFKNDLAATFTYLLFWYRAWMYWKWPGARSATWLAVALLLATLAKLSLLVLVAMAPLILALRGRGFWKSLALTTGILYAGTLAAYQFDASWYGLPANLVKGVTSLDISNAEHTSVYMLGQIYQEGHPLYFLVCLLIKTPVPVLLPAAAGLAVCLWRLAQRRLEAADLFWLLPGAIYFALASLANLQLGIRLILPAFPFALIIAGAALMPLAVGKRWLVPGAMVAWMIVTVARVYPLPLAFFNDWLGYRHAYRYLTDSNFDWGQDLPELADVARESRLPKFRLYYFGNDLPHSYFTPWQAEVLFPPWDDRLARGLRVPLERGIYAISASLLTGQYFRPPYRDYFKHFRDREPVGRAGESILIYQVD